MDAVMDDPVSPYIRANLFPITKINYQNFYPSGERPRGSSQLEGEIHYQ